MEQNQTRKKHKISYYLSLAFLLVGLYFAYEFYQQSNFHDFIRSETNLYTSHFKRDKEVTYQGKRTYKIENPEYNDAMFYKKVKVEKNQPYKVSCMVKTNNVQAKEEITGLGAQISIEGTTERSVAIAKTQDWQKIELIFNSKNREEINIGFRLGGYLGEVKGEAWFAEFSIEEGIPEKNSNWKFGCFIYRATDVTINQKRVQLEVTRKRCKRHYQYHSFI